MTGAPLGRQNGGPRRPKRKGKGCALVLLAGFASTLAAAIEIARSLT
jgi:hypothetical protein